jgi:hypothetical protein
MAYRNDEEISPDVGGISKRTMLEMLGLGWVGSGKRLS